MNEKKQFSLEYINLFFLVRIVLRNIWIPILLTLSVWFGISAAETFFYEPVYRTSAIMAVSAKESTNPYSSLNMTKDMTQVFAEVFQSDVLKKKVSEQLDGQEITGTISTQVIPETNLLQINYECESPETSYRILSEILSNYEGISDFLFDNAVLDVIKAPQVPVAPVNIFITMQRKKIFAAAGGVLGLLIILLLCVLDDSIQTVSAAKDRIDGKLYGVIPFEKKQDSKKKKKTSILITDSNTSFAYKESIHNLSTMIDHQLRKNDKKVIMITSTLENEGKSTVSSNIALALADRGRKVMLIDCDFRKPAVYRVFDLQDKVKTDFTEYLRNGCKGEYEVVKCKGIDLVLSKPSETGTMKLLHSEGTAGFISRMREKYDCIILDSAPLVVSDTEALIEKSDMSLLVICQMYASSGEINDSLDLLETDTNDKRAYIINRYRTFGKSDGEKHSAEHRTSKE